MPRHQFDGTAIRPARFCVSLLVQSDQSQSAVSGHIVGIKREGTVEGRHSLIRLTEEGQDLTSARPRPDVTRIRAQNAIKASQRFAMGTGLQRRHTQLVASIEIVRVVLDGLPAGR